jgi:NADH-quinone oxidoreductase subunit N
MSNALPQLLTLALPETIVGLGICVVLLAGLFSGARARDVTYMVAMATLACAAWGVFAATGAGEVDYISGGAFVVDPLARLLKLFALAAVAVVLVYSRAYMRDRQFDAGEFYVLVLFALLGIVVMVSSASFLMMYLGLETLSLALYAMVAVERDAPLGAEAAIKYFVLGAIASGCLLYGISLVYGVTGSVNFAEVAAALATAPEPPLAAAVGIGFLLVGIAFKFGAVPFHTWVPDVYQGAPACSTLFIASAPKIAAFALAMRLLVDGLSVLRADWQPVLLVVGLVSVAGGNLIAIAQTSIRRMLAYSTVGHVGFILLGFGAGVSDGVDAALFYTLIYVVMTTAVFGIIILLSPPGVEADALDDFRGLNQRSPWFAALMLLIMVSMIGVPPLAGFYAKWWILGALLDGGNSLVALAAVVFSVIGAFYYLRVIRLMYFEDVAGHDQLHSGLDLRVLLSLNALLVLGLGLFPGGLLELCARVLDSV